MTPSSARPNGCCTPFCEAGGVRELSLYWKVCLTNGAVFVVGALALALSPARVSEQVLASEAVVLTAGLVLMLVVNGALLRLSLAPVDRVIRAMATVDLAHPGARLEQPSSGPGARLVEGWNDLLDRIEAERAAGGARALAAQEAERHRIAQELHDEVGQSLTVVLLGLKRAEDQVPPDLPEIAEGLALVRESARAGLDDVRRVARRLRPGVLEDLGLHSALAALASDFAALDRGHLTRTTSPGLPPLSSDAELVVYRVAQEALTNVARHAAAREVALSLTRVGETVVLEVRDDGRGVAELRPGSGVLGMRERASLVGGELTIESAPGQGTTVRLVVPT
ncbi:sensor histidine kinase [Nocardioides sp. zg-579]|uniref:histidine kinase n=1 Tax=Nocardioides marmotae TaxID=2663857 RepID=A0A6I3J0V7_9ACTN|nr:sensor histidine kinase [Gordonia jinghuaiqii]MTB95147.1 sensor histidine kinase [Nocardioides marmotae]